MANAVEPGAENDRLGALMRAAQAGDTDAYGQLLQELAPRLRRIVGLGRGFLAREDIEDLVQDVLLSVHAARATYDPARPFMPWVLAITRNRLADGARRYARGAAHEVAVEDLTVTFSQSQTNLNASSRDDDYGDPEGLHNAVQALPPGQRTAIELLKLRELSLKEAAAANGSSVGALKIATHRAMTALRKKLVKN